MRGEVFGVSYDVDVVYFCVLAVANLLKLIKSQLHLFQLGKGFVVNGLFINLGVVKHHLRNLTELVELSFNLMEHGSFRC